LFCTLPISGDRVIFDHPDCYAIRDGFPVTEGHTLIIPKRHVESYFDLNKDEVLAVNEMIQHVHWHSREGGEGDGLIEGFNIGVNVGEVAGQTVMHCHVHLIPRRHGDHPNPRGGVRGVIPDKKDY
jgi:diadenosine tetraphosphate (Ap4A) HIT family hydrolase